MARWIHEFRSTGERALTDAERLALQRRVVGLAALRWSLVALGLASILGVVFGIAVAGGGNLLGWGGAVASLVAVCQLLSWAGRAEELALLHRRALRLSAVEGFRRVRGDETTRRLWQRTSTQVNAPEDEEEFAHLDPYWSVDERFEEDLARTARGRVEAFDAVGRDGAVLWVEGRPVRKIIEPPVWEAL